MELTQGSPYSLAQVRASGAGADLNPTDAAMLDYGYAQLTAATLGSAASALVMAWTVNQSGASAGLNVWLTLQLAISLAGLAAGQAYRSGLLRSRPQRALWLRRIVALSLGLCWCLGGIWWRVPTEEAGLAMLLCAAGLSAAGCLTLASDPAGFLLFSLPTLAPWLVLQAAERSWLVALLLFYLIALLVICQRCHHILERSFALRWENANLLERALEDREAAEAARRKAELAVASRTRFLASASHDLRQPVQALALFTEVLQQQTDETKRREVISAVARTTEALSAMLQSLLDISRLETGTVRSAPRRIALRKLLDDTTRGLRADAEARGVQVRTLGPSCQVHADPDLLTQVVRNLTVNAVRHAGRGRVLVAVRRRADHCLVQVWDQGPGIAPEDQQRIFDELVQLANPARDRQKGLGLGLSMVRRICELNDWPLSLHSRPGRGSVFTVRLPRAVSLRPTPEALTVVAREL